jgi:HNH endonuclease
LPNSLRTGHASWGGHRFSSLSEELQHAFQKTQLTVILIQTDQADEVRDLFVRLQAGTALTRQEVRDAWPGNLGPFVVRLAGRKESEPEFKLPFRLDSSDEDEDPFGPNRQFVAQLLLLYLTREKDSLNFPSLGASELDELYHERPDFDADGPGARRFIELLQKTHEVCGFGKSARDETGKKRNKTKFSKMQIFSVFCLLQDLSRSPNFKLDLAPAGPLGHYLRNAEHKLLPGRSTSGKKIQDYYRKWRDGLPAEIGVRLDSRRVFSEEQKAEMLERGGGRCGMCAKEIVLSEAEGDHYPLAWRHGGPTEIENGRLVHKTCHIRGRPAASEDVDPIDI